MVLAHTLLARTQIVVHKEEPLTLMPRGKKVPQNAQQEQSYDEAENIRKAHHKPQGSASYNPDDSVANKLCISECSREICATKCEQHAYTAATAVTIIFRGRQ